MLIRCIRIAQDASEIADEARLKILLVKYLLYLICLFDVFFRQTMSIQAIIRVSGQTSDSE